MLRLLFCFVLLYCLPSHAFSSCFVLRISSLFRLALCLLVDVSFPSGFVPFVSLSLPISLCFPFQYSCQFLPLSLCFLFFFSFIFCFSPLLLFGSHSLCFVYFPPFFIYIFFNWCYLPLFLFSFLSLSLPVPIFSLPFPLFRLFPFHRVSLLSRFLYFSPFHFVFIFR